ncbi:MAG: serine/threonine protein kinase [Pirellulales bacterium]|nr:serine/threonine protein kinase [Pirellulales bacterium]
MSNTSQRETGHATTRLFTKDLVNDDAQAVVSDLSVTQLAENHREGREDLTERLASDASLAEESSSFRREFDLSNGAVIVDSPAAHELNTSAHSGPPAIPSAASEITQATPEAGRRQAPRTLIQRALAEELTGQMLEHFELREFIGGGGMGVVFRAYDTRLKRTVALKVLSPDAASQPDVLKRFRVEAESAARLDHQGIARVFYVGEDNGFHFLAFEFVEGDNLRDLVIAEGALPWKLALDLTFQIAQALEHASERGVVHRDIKPSNVLVTPAGRAKLVDMGLARLGSLGPRDDLTNSGATLGTFDYVSPEQAHDPRHADVRSDIYSLGCTLYFLLTGQPPFPEGTMLQKLLRHQGAEPTDVRDLNPDVPGEVAGLLRTMLAKSPRSRQQTAHQLLVDVTAAADSLGLDLADSSGEYRIAEPLWMALTRQHAYWLVPTLALVFCVVLLDVFLSQSGDSRSFRPYSPLDAPQAYLQSSNNAAGISSDDGSRQADDDGALVQANQGADNQVDSSVGDLSVEQVAAPSDTNLAESDGQSGAALSGALQHPPSSTDPNQPPPVDTFLQPLGNSGTAIVQTDDEDKTDLGPLQGQLPASNTLANSDGSPKSDNQGRAEIPSELSPPDLPPGEDLLPSPGIESVASPSSTGNTDLAVRTGPQRLIVDPQAPNAEPQTFRTLKSALEAAQSGDWIELHFTGRLTESEPIQLPDANLVLRAGEGHRPVIVFRPQEPPATRSMLDVRGDKLEVINVDFELDLAGNQSAAGLSLFEIGASRLIFEGCWLTIINAQNHPFTSREMVKNQDVRFVSVRSHAQEQEMLLPEVLGNWFPVAPKNASATAKIELRDCVARGEGSLVNADGLATEISWHNGILATSGYLLNGHVGSEEQVAPLYSLDVKHLTAKLGKGLVKISNPVSQLAQGLVLKTDFADSILIGDTNSVLLTQTGPEPVDVQRSAVSWLGSGIFYENFTRFWEIVNASDPWNPTSFDETAWNDAWPGSSGPMHGSRAYFANVSHQDALYHKHSILAYTLDESMDNAARLSGSDGLDAGAVIQVLPDAPSEKFAPRTLLSTSPRPSL